MPITFLPSDFSAELAPESLINKLVTRKLTVNRAALRMIANVAELDNKTAQEIVMNVINGYQEKSAELQDNGIDSSDANEQAANDNKLLIQRVRNAITHEVAKKVKLQYLGTRYIWLPSSAETADPLHQLNYGAEFTLGEGDSNGEDPGDRYGCQCGMRILTPDDTLDVFTE